MLFSSNVFLYVFLPAILVSYYLVPRRFRTPVLLAFSLFFYGWGEPVYLLLMMGDILLNYVCGLWIAADRKKGLTGRRAMVTGVAANLALLGYFKYAGFLFGSLLPEVPLPIGISFYIFQSMSYLIDVYRNDAPLQRNLVAFGTYVTLFPQLIAGPIVRYADVAHMLEHRKENLSQFSSGILRFVFGLAKKVLLANPMGNLWNLMQSSEGTAAAWLGLVAYSLQIYFDFSGYSDMAIGLGRMFGFEFLENFRYPYISKSITEFWRRWHISLGTWFREYVYIPLGGNRKGYARQVLNIAAVWLLTGLWHGASWNYVLWGGMFAVLLILEKLFLLKWLKKAPAVLCHGYTLLAVLLSWCIFYFEDFGALLAFLPRLITPVSSAGARGIILGHLPIVAAAMLASTPVADILCQRYREREWMQWGKVAAAGVLMLLCVCALASQSYNPFIYFRF